MAENKSALTSQEWEEVWKFYCAGIKPLRDIATEFGISEGAIRKRAKRDGWVRDLTNRIQAKANELVRKQEVRNTGTQSTHPNEREIIEANAEQQSTIILHERKDVSKARSIAMSLLAELESQVNNKDLYEKLGEILNKPDDKGSADKLNEIYRRVISFGGRTDSMKKLGETLKTLIDLERRVYKIDDAGTEGGVEDFLRKIRGV